MQPTVVTPTFVYLISRIFIFNNRPSLYYIVFLLFRKYRNTYITIINCVNIEIHILQIYLLNCIVLDYKCILLYIFYYYILIYYILNYII